MAGFGPPAIDWSPLANLGKTFFDAQDRGIKRQESELKRQTLASLGQDFQKGDFGGAAQKLAALGDVGSAAQVYGLGQKMKESAREEEWLRNNSGILGGSPAAPTAPSAPSTTSGGPASLIQNESGGNWQAQNNAVGAGGQRGHFGRLQFGQARIQEAAAAGAIPQGTTPQAFMQSPELQQRAEAWHWSDIDNHIRQTGLDRAVGQTINGVPVTVEGMRAVAHLGGKGGLSKFIETGGRYNPADENGTRLSDYFARHGGGGTQVASPVAPVQQAPLAPPGVQVAQNEADVQRLEAQMPGFGGGAPVQMAQAPAADLPAPGAAPAQGFAIPGAQADASIANDPRVQRLQRKLAGAPDKFKPAITSQLNILVEELKAQRQQSAPTNSYRDYERARTDPAYRDFLKEQRAQTNVTVDQRAQSEEEKALGQAAGKRAGEAMASAASGMKQLQRIGQLEGLMKNVETGRLQPGRMTMAALGKSLGVNEDFLRSIGLDPAQVGDAQALNAITGRMVVDMIGSGGFPANNFSDADRAFITGTVPSLANDPRGNKIIMEAARRSAQIDIEKAKAWRDWRKDNKGGSFDDFEVQWGDKLASQDRFSDLAKQAESITGPQKPAATGWQDLGGGIRIRPVEKR